MNSQRTILGYLKYNNYLSKASKDECVFCSFRDQIVLNEYKYWTLVKNKFPWKMWTEHNLLVLKRHLEPIELDKLKPAEVKELNEIRIKHPEHIFMHTAPRTVKVSHLAYHICK